MLCLIRIVSIPHMHKVAVLRYMPHEVKNPIAVFPWYSIAKAVHEYKTATSEKKK